MGSGYLEAWGSLNDSMYRSQGAFSGCETCVSFDISMLSSTTVSYLTSSPSQDSNLAWNCKTDINALYEESCWIDLSS